jgi:SAM-dependent methyltransferase
MSLGKPLEDMEWFFIGISIAAGVYLFQVFEKFLLYCYSKLEYCNFRFQNFLTRRQYNKDRNLKDIKKKEKNYLLLFHGRKHSIPSASVNFRKGNSFTVANDPDDNPHILLDLSFSNSLDAFPEDSFDLITISLCTCHHLDLVFKEQEDYFIKKTYALLKNKGRLTIKGPQVISIPYAKDLMKKFLQVGYLDARSCGFDDGYNFVKEKVPKDYQDKWNGYVKMKTDKLDQENKTPELQPRFLCPIKED